MTESMFDFKITPMIWYDAFEHIPSGFRCIIEDEKRVVLLVDELSEVKTVMFDDNKNIIDRKNDVRKSW